MDKRLVQYKAPRLLNLKDAALYLGLPEKFLDADFGVLEMDIKDGVYLVRIEGVNMANLVNTLERHAINGNYEVQVYSDPIIEII